ncbi:hypothetical protein IQ266_18855 [filamentous cyanobacterium LEGE 11480]|uniref:Uncharacterized protein n=1 Tax=Romeriopsis navalis LEGE 11480 TaxID=2777977 RepID=A0A928VNF1_9CYAN|nr:hypothetical protein [Romeriopsis navalis]MBE9031798.1 hypothetical protein [Romeriopsis navalis LEGE 11480]
MKLKGINSLIGAIFLAMLFIRMLSDGAIQRSKNGTTFNHKAATKALLESIEPFEENFNKSIKPRK